MSSNENINKNKFKFSDFPQIKEFCLTQINANIESPFPYSFWMNICLIEKENIVECLTICEKLAGELDIIRQNYWFWFQENIKKDFGIN